MATAGYLEYDSASHRFTLPPEHAPALAQESSPVFFGGVYQMMTGMSGVLDQLTAAFRAGGGVPQSAYAADMWDGLERFTNGWFENLLIQQWIPAMPEVQAKLERGAWVADVGCGRGRALIKLAQAFPQARYIGYDIFAPTIERATENARAAGVAERVRFTQLDVSQGIPERSNVITTFNVVHDAVDPVGLLRTIRRSLRADGVYVCLDINCSDKLQENQGPLGAMFYGFSVLYCMTTSLAGGGHGPGDPGLSRTQGAGAVCRGGFQQCPASAVGKPVQQSVRDQAVVSRLWTPNKHWQPARLRSEPPPAEMQR